VRGDAIIRNVSRHVDAICDSMLFDQRRQQRQAISLADEHEMRVGSSGNEGAERADNRLDPLFDGDMSKRDEKSRRVANVQLATQSLTGVGR
jgi:hypothetical protein